MKMASRTVSRAMASWRMQHNVSACSNTFMSQHTTHSYRPFSSDSPSISSGKCLAHDLNCLQRSMS